MMDYMIWIGAVISVAGIVGLLWCVILALRARKAGLPDDQMRLRLQRVVVINMGALGVSALGLMLIVTGILLA